MTFRRVSLILVLLAIVLSSVAVASAQDSTHVVQPGETLSAIARQYGLTVEQIAAANGITNPDRIYAGQVLVIPGGSSGGSTGGNTATSSYTVVAGDTLSQIARRFGTTVATLAQLNGLSNVDLLFIGQVLVVPSQGGQPAATTAPPSTETPPTSTPVETITYTVQQGDTLSRIALRFDTTYQAIALLNNLPNPDVIYPGQVLVIREGTVTPTPPPATTAPPSTTEPATTEATTIPSPTPTATPKPEETGEPVFSSPTPIVSLTQVPSDAPNLFLNPGLEGSARRVGADNVNVLTGWEPFYCDQPYTTDRCRALRLGDGNMVNLMMTRPTYLSTGESSRVHSGATAQQWACPWQACRGGIYQTVQTTPGALCEAGAYVQSWSSNEALNHTSDLVLRSDRENATWFIIIDLGGGTNLYAGNNEYVAGVQASRGFGYDDGIYDQYRLISYTFTATGNRATVYFENLRLWPYTHNVNYLDDAYLRCAQ
ncbi:MAG: LysM peptidoglycan-binding domain-containing protein [Anaerolineae bacterium]|nr:LysM peptidoglycan-binding domain-containing protein [Anaerolineae bacterium]